MLTNEIRERYLEFFKLRGHTVCSSDVLVPKWDPTVLFTPAGMNPFKDHFLGKVKLDFKRATSCQKCLRTGDIENVGRTAYHHTFFEMLGNFSFGDYFKAEAIQWAWEFLTSSRWLAIDPARLTVSVYQDDQAAADIWHQKIGLPDDRIAFLGEHDNFWPAGAPSDGPDGVCGPCSEIFYHPDSGPECEIWNLVFTQFNRLGDPPDNLQPLPSRNIDTGMGLERMAATLQGVDTNFHIDILLPMVQAAAEVCDTTYQPETGDGRRLRRIADHVRACTMAIHENVYPDKQKENYVIRRLLRRAVLQGHGLGMREPFLHRIVPAVVEQMSQPYPELKETARRISQVIETEEQGFLQTLEEGMPRIERIFESLQTAGKKQVDGGVAFDLYQEQGIPAELFESIARDRGFEFDRDSWNEARERHARESGSGPDAVMGDFGPLDTIKRDSPETDFTGYACTRDQGTIRGLVDGDQLVQRLEKSTGEQRVVLDRSPFYGESGGQVGDRGTIRGPAGTFSVSDVQKNGNILVHIGSVSDGCLATGETVAVEVDLPRRNGIERAHSGTHILHYALQKHVGQHARQSGSRVEQDWLRFDFSNQAAVSREALEQIEQETRQRIREDHEIRSEILPMADARAQGAMMLFGEKYPDPVRMVSIGEFSKELCGGTHVPRSSEIGDFEIVSEEAVSAGTRRITALTGERARQHAVRNQEIVRRLSEITEAGIGELEKQIDHLLKRVKSLRKMLTSGKAARPPEANRPGGSSGPDDTVDYPRVRDTVRNIARNLNVAPEAVVDRVESLLSELEDLEVRLESMATRETVSADQLLSRAFDADGTPVVVSEVPGANVNELRGLVDQLRKQNSGVAVFLASIQGSDKVMLLAGLGRDAVARGLNAGDWVKAVAPTVGGGGGGRPDMAQAGGKLPEKLNQALDAARQFVVAATAS